MQSFNFCFGIQLGVLVLRHTKTHPLLRDTQTCTFDIIRLSNLQKHIFQHNKGSERQLVFVCFLKQLEINDPKLPTKRKVLSHYEEGKAPVEFVSTVEEHYRQIFYQVVDIVFSFIRDRI